MKITIILGSIRKNRKSGHVAYHLKKLVGDVEGVDAQLLDLRDYPFPVLEERYRFLENPPEYMKEFSRKMSESDGIIIVTPEYNGSYSGALKNALDYFKPEYHKKPMGVVTVSDGQWGGINASHHLLSWILHVKAIPSPFKLMVQNAGDVFDGDGNLTDEKFDSRAGKFIDEFLWLSKSIASNA
jgi:NAD(P)H-dependent FMN reductase